MADAVPEMNYNGKVPCPRFWNIPRKDTSVDPQSKRLQGHRSRQCARWAIYNRCWDVALIVLVSPVYVAHKFGPDTTLGMVVERGHAAVVGRLLDKGAKSELMNDTGMTALGVAIAAKNTPMLELLTKRINLDDFNK